MTFGTRIKEWLRHLASAFRAREEKLSAKEEATLLRQFSLMMESGFAFFDGLHLLSETLEGAPAKLCEEVAEDVRTGRSLSAALSRRGERLSQVTPHLVAAGEDSGSLALTMKMAATWAEGADEMLAKVKAALIYPIFVLIANVVMAVSMLVYVLPAFTPLFEGDELPILTTLVLAASDACQSPIFWLVVVLIGLEVFLFTVKPDAQAKAYKWSMSVPVLGHLLRSAARARFVGVVAITTRTGLSVLRSLSLAAQASGDTDFIELDFDLQRSMREGGSMSPHFVTHRKVYGPILSQGMMLCEETGEFEKVTTALASYFRTETDLNAERFRALFEPLMMVFVSASTVTILLAIYLPMVKFIETLMA